MSLLSTTRLLDASLCKPFEFSPCQHPTTLHANQNPTPKIKPAIATMPAKRKIPSKKLKIFDIFLPHVDCVDMFFFLLGIDDRDCSYAALLDLVDDRIC